MKKIYEKTSTGLKEVDLGYSKTKIITLTDNNSTTAGTWLAKTDEISAYEDGQIFFYKVVVAGASTTTLNITGSGGTALGAKTIYRMDSTKLTTHYGVGKHLLIVYDSADGCFRALNDYDANTNTTVRQYQSGANAAGSGTNYPILTRYGLDNKNGTYDNTYARFHTDVTIDTATGNLKAPSLGLVPTNYTAGPNGPRTLYFGNTTGFGSDATYWWRLWNYKDTDPKGNEIYPGNIYPSVTETMSIGSATYRLKNVCAVNFNASEKITVKDTNVSLDGHKHTKADITDFPTKISAFTNDSGFITSSGSITGNAATATNLVSFTHSYHRPVANGGDGKQWMRIATVVDDTIDNGSRWYGKAVDIEFYNNGYGNSGSYVYLGHVSLCVTVHNNGTFVKEAVTIKWRECKKSIWSPAHIKAVKTKNMVEFFMLNDIWDTPIVGVIVKQQSIAVAASNTLYTPDDFAAYIADKEVVTGILDTAFNFGTAESLASMNISQFTNDSKYLTAHQDISGKLDKSGGTMTGAITLKSETSAWNDSGIKFKSGGTIGANNSGNVGIRSATDTIFAIGASSTDTIMRLTGSELRPNTNKGLSLGTSSYYWNNIYGTAIYDNGNRVLTSWNKASSLTVSSTDTDKVPSVAAVASLCNNILEVANGRTKTYVANLAAVKNVLAEGDVEAGTNVSLSATATLTTIDGTVALSSLKVGDIILVVETDVPDFFVTATTSQKVSLSKLETTKVNLDPYAKKSTTISSTSTSAGVTGTLGGTVNAPTITMSVSGGSVASGNTSVVTGGTVHTALQSYLPLSGGTMTGDLKFGDGNHKIFQHDSNTNITTAAKTVAIPANSGSKGIAILADEGNDYGLMYVGSDGALVCNSGDLGYCFSVYDKDASKYMFRVAQNGDSPLSKFTGAVEASTFKNTDGTEVSYVGHTHSQYLTAHQDISGKENTSNKVTSLSSSSTNTQYPSAKLLYDMLPKVIR